MNSTTQSRTARKGQPSMSLMLDSNRRLDKTRLRQGRAARRQRRSQVRLGRRRALPLGRRRSRTFLAGCALTALRLSVTVSLPTCKGPWLALQLFLMTSLSAWPHGCRLHAPRILSEDVWELGLAILDLRAAALWGLLRRRLRGRRRIRRLLRSPRARQQGLP